MEGAVHRLELELALIDIRAHVRSTDFLKWYYLFEYGFLAFENKGFDGKISAARIWDESLPWSGIQNLEGDQSIIRVYNPFKDSFQLSKVYTGTDPFGQSRRDVNSITPNQIEHLLYAPLLKPVRDIAPTNVEMIGFPEWPVGEDRSTIDNQKLAELRHRADALTREQSEAQQRLAQAGADHWLPGQALERLY